LRGGLERRDRIYRTGEESEGGKRGGGEHFVRETPEKKVQKLVASTLMPAYRLRGNHPGSV